MSSSKNADVYDLLDLLSLPLALSRPIFDDGELVDLELSWINKTLGQHPGTQRFHGAKLTNVFPELSNGQWLKNLQNQQATQTSTRIFRRPLADAPDQTDVYWLDFRWLNNEVLVTVEFLNGPARSRSEAMRSASIVTNLISRVPVLYSIRTADQWLRFSTHKFAKIMQWDDNEIQVFDILKFAHPEDLIGLKAWLNTPLEERTMPLITRLVARDGMARWCELWMSEITDGESHPDGDLLLIRDINSQITLQNENAKLTVQLEAELASVKAALNASNEGFAIWRAIRSENNEVTSYILDFMNTTGAAPTGKRPDELEGRTIEDVLGEDQYKELMALFTAAIKTGDAQRAVVDFESPSGWTGAYEDYIVPFMSDRVLASFRDISAEKMEQQRLKWLADHDHLTGIPNRAHLDNYLDKALIECRTSNQKLGFVFIDIDDFKTINDTLGHDAGDRLLINFVKRLQNAVPESALVARIAGDEFAIVFHDLEDILTATKYLESIFATMKRDFNHDHPPIRITVSAGCAVSDGKITASELMRIADRAMYRSKHEGKDRFTVVSNIGGHTLEFLN